MPWNVSVTPDSQAESMTADAAHLEFAARSARLLEAFPVSAAPFIVTLYGDVVAPRGGEIWTGNIVETLATAGIGESRVRTALSRLVAAGRLEGTKEGRRSYYRLTSGAAADFTVAARLIYTPVEPPPLRGWHLVALPDEGREAAARTLAQQRFGFVSPHLAVLPDRGAPLPRLPGCLFSATTQDEGLRDLLAAAWPLPVLAERMRWFVGHFGRLEAEQVPSAAALGLRLLLVHAYRELALRDPLLPPALLPPDWPGRGTRALFVRLYQALSPAAEADIAARFVDRTGTLRPDRKRLERRRSDLAAPPLQ
jgi:phenylacetic acid degradation operon negative regulatory protein